MATTLSEQINVRFSSEEYAKLIELATTADRTASYIVRKIVREELQRAAEA